MNKTGKMTRQLVAGRGVALALVLPLLIPSDGNHTPRETIAIKDLESTLALLLKLCTGPDILDLFQHEAFTWSLCD